jgi:hypothetical protein
MSTFAFGNGGVPQSRVVYRGSNNANPNCGVSYTNANNDASASHTNVGSRLANNQSVPRQGWTCPHCRTEGGKPRQKHSSGWKAGTSSVGWSLVGPHQDSKNSGPEKGRLMPFVYKYKIG